MPSNIFTGMTTAVTASTSATIIRAANSGRKYLAIALPVAGTLWVGTPGVTTTGAAAGFPVLLNQPFIMSDPDSVYTGAIWGITTAICTPSIVELST
jgi:drug/metabolite transporter (DMT)-like permease